MYLIKHYKTCPYYVYTEAMQYRAVVFKNGLNYDIPLDTAKYAEALAKIKAFIDE